MKRIATLATAAAAAITNAASAQDLTVSPGPEPNPVVITGATIHTAVSDPLEDGVLVFQDGRITHVGPSSSLASLSLPASVRTIDADGMHVYPGLIASNTVLGLTEISSVRATQDSRELNSFSPEVRANVAVNPDSTLIPVTRINGVLAAGVFPSGGRVPGRLSVMQLDGWTWEDMTLEADAGLVMSWPQMRPRQSWFAPPQSDQQRRIDEALHEIDAVFDAAEAYAQLTNPTDTDIRFEAMKPYLTATPAQDRKPIYISADDIDQITAAVTWCQSRGYKCVIVGGRDAEYCADILTATNTPVILSGVHRFPRRADASYEEAFNQPARLAELGITFAIDTSDRDGNARNLPYEAALARRHGLSSLNTLRALTITPAQILGVDDKIGSLEQGKHATLFIADGDIFEVTSRVTHVFIAGRDIPMQSKQTDLRDKYVEKYKQLGVIED